MPDAKPWFVYIVECSDGTYYTGITTDVEKRVNAHNTGKRAAKYTRSRAPVTLMRSFKVNTKSVAEKGEYRIKQLSREDKLKVVDVNPISGQITIEENGHRLII